MSLELTEATTQQFPAPLFQDEVLDFTPSAAINKRLSRYLWWAGDVIPERRKFDFKDGDRNAGGDELTSRCLWRTRGYLRRGRITPLEVGPEWHTKEEISEQQINSALNSGQVTMSVKGQPEFYGEDVLPGDEIASILSADDVSGIPKGIVELTPLVGYEWKNDPSIGTDIRILVLQRYFFPRYPEIPARLADLQALINAASGELTGFTSADLQTIARQKNDSCDTFRLWGTNYVERENQHIASRVGVGGFTYQYSDTAKVIMRQLDIEPLTIAQLKDKAASMNKEELAFIAATAAAEAVKASNVPKTSSFDDLREMIKQNPDEFKALFAELVPRRGRPPKEE